MNGYYQIVESERLFFKDNHEWLFKGDSRSMWELPNGCVQMICCSPPYWGLRKYSGEQELIWGGNPLCKHEWESEQVWLTNSSSGVGKQTTDKGTIGVKSNRYGKQEFCSLCGAWKGAYGLEPTPEMYIQHTIEILREIRRVLRKDGVVFWNIGDSYAGSGCGTNDYRTEASRSINKSDVMFTKKPPQQKAKAIGLKPKDLCLIPFRVAIAAQEDGWWVRSVIIWSKPNPMPESVTDRPTESHEYILMLTKSAKYYWDADAVRVPLAEGSWERAQRSELTAHSVSRIRNKGTGTHGRADLAGRNIRTVWEFPTQPYPEAHFAVFPEKLPELCIKAATPEVGCCSKCGAPWERVRENIGKVKQGWGVQTKIPPESGGHTGLKTKMINQFETLGWQPTCKCNADKVPSLVLDPFAGTGTVGWVAKKLNRCCVMYELSEEYCELGLERNRQGVMELTV